MIRAVALLTGLVLGLGLAVAAYGRMGHLRLLMDLPGWTGAIAADAGLLAGQARLPAGFALDWRLAGIGRAGPVWSGAIHRHDTRLDLTAGLQPGPGTGLHLWLRLDPGTATPGGPRLSGHFPSVTGTGLVAGSGLSLELEGRGTRIRAGDTDRPDGPVTLSLGPDGWRLSLGDADRWRDQGTDPAELLGD